MYNHQLDTFIVVADSGSFNKAAEALFISPPAVIKQINLLEDSLGVRLFTRTHRGLQLTKAGQSVYEDARYIIPIAVNRWSGRRKPMTHNRLYFVSVHRP